MTWLSDLSCRVGFNVHKNKERPILGILAFEAARTMSRLVSLYKSHSEDEVTKLRKDVMRSLGVAYLNSMDEGFLLKLACAERLEDLDRSAIAVARFGKKCVDPGLTQFEFAYADLKLGLIDTAKLDVASKEIDKVIEKMEKYVSATCNLYAALEALSEMEALEKITNRWKDHSGPIPMYKPKQEFSEKNLMLQRQQVQHLKEISLWNQSFDKVVGFMARTVCIVYARICRVYGPHISVLPSLSSRHARFSSQQLQYQENGEDSLPITSRSGPISTGSARMKQQTSGAFIRFQTKCTKPVSGENIGFRIRAKQNHDIGFGWIEKTTRLCQQAPPTSVGSTGLVSRYASLITQLEKYLESPSSLTDCGRHDFYDMLPQNLRLCVNTRLKSMYRRNKIEWEDAALVEGWRDGLKVIMGWLGPMAHDTVKWMSERSPEKYNFDAKPTVLLLQTLYFADREKTEAAMVEVMVGLSFICRYGINSSDKVDS
ncbi:hypothetical protein ACHQM5_020176 [Ranunculus cassubicifolius]